MVQILIFGDSITYGAWDKEGGWVRRLRKFLDENYEDYLIYNLGISGNNTDDLIERFEFETKQRLKENDETIIIFAIGVGLTPVDETKTTPIPWNTDKSYKNEYIQKYNETIKNICDENKIYFIEVFEKLKETNYQELLEDGLHPSSVGHQKIFEVVKDFLIENKII